ncbi:MAG: ATP-dependent metallopeptidase FtsH/Yme1/Tma family protein, partial [Anaerolineae bacterium]
MDTRQAVRWVIYLVLMVMIAFFLYNQMSANQPQPESISLQQLASDIKDGDIATIKVEGDQLLIERING